MAGFTVGRDGSGAYSLSYRTKAFPDEPAEDRFEECDGFPGLVSGILRLYKNRYWDKSFWEARHDLRALEYPERKVVRDLASILKTAARDSDYCRRDDEYGGD